MSGSLRDTRAGGEHFEALLKSYGEAIEEFRGWVPQRPDVSDAKHLSRLHMYQRVTLLIVSVLYSAGAPMNEVRRAAREAVRAQQLYGDFRERLAPGEADLLVSRAEYMIPLQIVSFAVLAGEPQEVIADLRRVSGVAGKDHVYDVMTGVVTPAEAIGWPKPYARLAAVVDAEPSDRPRLMARFLKAWYNQSRGMEWWGTHKYLGPRSVYPGYWCYEAAAVTKVLDIDDSSYRDNEYYPRDFVG